MTDMPGLGYIPDPEAPRHGDRFFRPMGGALPDEDVHLVDHVQQILDQDGAEACVGAALAQGCQIQLSSEGLEPILPSAGFIWYNARKSLGDESRNVGTYIYSGVQAMSDFGLPPDADWPIAEVGWRFAERPSHIAYAHAFDAKFGVQLFRVGKTKEEVQSAIHTFGPVIFGTAVTKAFTETGPHAIPILPPGDGDEIAGGHAMTIAGYDKWGVRIPQTWGSLVGNAGWYYLSWDYILSDWTSELVCVKYVPKLVEG